MLTFQNTDKKNLGRADCIKLVAVENGDQISEVIGRPTTVYFLMRVRFNMGHEYFDDNVPTGVFDTPYIVSPDEYLITDGDTFWEAARFKTPEELAEAGTRTDPTLYILSNEKLPPRMQRLSQLDKQHILDKIRVFCDKMTNDLRQDET